MRNIQKDFPILKRKIHGKRLVYVDNAATTQKPQCVIDAISQFYTMHNANIHRGIHTLGEEATLLYEEAHKKTAAFIHAASWREIIFTKNTTEALNLLAYTLPQLWKKRDEIIITEQEHHSNYVPWQQAAKRHELILKIAPLTNGTVDIKTIGRMLTKKTKLASVAHISNVLGGITDIKALAKIVHANKTLLCIDGAQSVPHMPIDVQGLDCDFLCFSSHKMLGPFGIGVLYGKKALLEKMPIFLTGGGMIGDIGEEETTWNELPWKFEAGTPDIAGAAGFSAALDYLQQLGMENVWKHDQELVAYALKRLKEENDVVIYGAEKRGAVISFNIRGIHAHDVAAILNEEGIACRAGHHCAQPLFKRLQTPAAVRISFSVYNTKEDIDICIAALQKAKKVFA